MCKVQKAVPKMKWKWLEILFYTASSLTLLWHFTEKLSLKLRVILHRVLQLTFRMFLLSEWLSTDSWQWPRTKIDPMCLDENIINGTWGILSLGLSPSNGRLPVIWFFQQFLLVLSWQHTYCFSQWLFDAVILNLVPTSLSLFLCIFIIL